VLDVFQLTDLQASMGVWAAISIALRRRTTSRCTVAVTMAIGSLVGAIVLLRLDLNGLARGSAAGLGQRLDQAALFVDEPAQRLAEDALRQQDVAQ